MSQHTTSLRRAEAHPFSPVAPAGPPQPGDHPPQDPHDGTLATAALVPQWNPDDGDFA
jgi:hypothetical protein